jgi:hypothetical protein
MTSISLGWDCGPAIKGVEYGFRKRKSEGYMTCPFDGCITNYNGIILCIKEDFVDFFNPEYLKIIKSPLNTTNTAFFVGTELIHNTKYKFIFNHESPAETMSCNSFPNGKYHYVDDNFKLFIERYSRRIHNFRNYVNACDECFIKFIISKFNPDLTEIINALQITYPKLQYNKTFDIMRYDPHHDTLPINIHYIEHFKLMQIDNEDIENEIGENKNIIV